MTNTVFIEVYSKENSSPLKLPIESLITYCIYKYCNPDKVYLKFVHRDIRDEPQVSLNVKETFSFIEINQIPWQVKCCLYPVVMYNDTIITGLCAVARHICKYRSNEISSREHEEGILGFRKSCLQAPNEVSIWTKFCEVDTVKTVKELLQKGVLTEIPMNFVRFENHLRKPVRLHNVYKVARNMKKDKIEKNNEVQLSTANLDDGDTIHMLDKDRICKSRKWKSTKNKQLLVDRSIKIKDLEIMHDFAEGPFLTLADIILLPAYHICVQRLGSDVIKSMLPLTYKWYSNVIKVPEAQNLMLILCTMDVKQVSIDGDGLSLPETEDVSLYKCDPKRHNPKKRIFTKEADIETALSFLVQGLEIDITSNEMTIGIDWKSIPPGANPTAGHLPDERMFRKAQQLENLALAVMSLANDGELLVDFCSGSGHLGILLAHLLPKCTVILLENKEQSLLRARQRVHDMGLNNVYFFQCNLDFFIGKFDIGIALHACGIATDLVLDKCLKANSKFVLCPCCYGSVHVTDRLAYPRSLKFQTLSIDKYLCIGHAADQTHEEHPLTKRGARCMVAIDSDRGRLAEQHGYNVKLCKLKPLTCTPKNNLLIGIPG